MLLVPCPHCGPRAEIEFAYAGEADIERPQDPNAMNDDEWAAYLFVRSNHRGQHRELWRHVHGCGRFFRVIRDTVTDRFDSPGAGP